MQNPEARCNRAIHERFECLRQDPIRIAVFACQRANFGIVQRRETPAVHNHIPIGSNGCLEDDGVNVDASFLMPAAKTYRVSALYERVPYPAPEGIQPILDEISLQNPEAKSYKPEDFIDTTVVKQLEQSGFVRSVYR
jgi:hypothetical protein